MFFKSIQTSSLNNIQSIYKLGKTRIFDNYFLTDRIQMTVFIYSIFGDTILIAFKNIVQKYNYRTKLCQTRNEKLSKNTQMDFTKK